MQAGGWANKTSRKARKKKGATFTKGSISENDKKKKKKSSKRKNGANQNVYNKYNDDYYYEPMLSNKQYRISQKISQFWPNYKCEHVLPKIITKLNLTHFDPNDERQKIEILDCLLCELIDAISLSGKSKKNRREKERKEREKREREQREERERKNQQNQLFLKTKLKSKKSGKFRQFMLQIGAIFLDYLDKETLATLLRIESFAFIQRPKLQILTTKQRLTAYISPKDILFRIKSFNSKLNTLSSLKLYKFKSVAAEKELNTTQYIKVIALNMFNLDRRFRVRTSAKTMAYHPNMIQMDIRKNYHLSNTELMEKIIKSNCKIFNIWNVIHITDVNEGYLTEFGEYQDGNTTDERIFLNHLNKFIIDKSVISQQNIKSINCGYIKVIKDYELHSFLCLFIELNTDNYQNIYDQSTRQFMVWNGACGIKSTQRH